MDDAIPPADFVKAIEEALRLTGALVSELPALAHSALVEGCFLEGEARSDARRGWILRTILRWGMENLRPSSNGKDTWLLDEWRLYNVLHYSYFEGMTWAALAARMVVTVPAVYKRRQKAITHLARTIYRALTTPQGATELRAYLLKVRLDSLTKAERRALTLASLFRRPIPRTLLHRADRTALVMLLDAGLLCSRADGTLIEIPPDIRASVLMYLPPPERRRGHEIAARHYEAQHDYLEAAYHWHSMDDEKGATAAAALLLAHPQERLDQQQHQDLGILLAKFREHELPPDLWFRIKLLAGDMARGEDVERAEEEYRIALASQTLEIKISAYYRLGEVYKQRNLDEAITYYTRCLELLAKALRPTPLLMDICLNVAWIFIQERPNLALAKRALARAKRLRDGDPTQQAKFYNTRARFFVEQRNAVVAAQKLLKAQGATIESQALHSLTEQAQQFAEKVLEYRLKALRAATESQNRDLQLKIAKNLGFDYAECYKEYEKALYYLQRALAMAQDAGDRQMEGLCLKDVGSCYFWQEEYRTALDYYQRAYAIFAEMGNLNWQAGVCLDLAEAYAELWEILEARQSLAEALTLSRQVRHAGYSPTVAKLKKRYGFLAKKPSLNSRQWQALAHVREHGKMTIQDQISLTTIPISKRTANRDLTKLVEAQIFTFVEKGPHSYYKLAPPRKA